MVENGDHLCYVKRNEGDFLMNGGINYILGRSIKMDF